MLLPYDVGMLYTIIPISIGAIGGALLRHFVATSTLLNFTLWGFSWGILLCNIIGSFALGVFVESGGRFFNISPTAQMLVVTGFLGSFTTFSTFSLQTIDLMKAGQGMTAIIYVMVSVCVSLLALYVGMQVMKIW